MSRSAPTSSCRAEQAPSTCSPARPRGAGFCGDPRHHSKFTTTPPTTPYRSVPMFTECCPSQLKNPQCAYAIAGLRPISFVASPVDDERDRELGDPVTTTEDVAGVVDHREREVVHRRERPRVVFGLVLGDRDERELGVLAMEALDGRQRAQTRSAVLGDELQDGDVTAARRELEPRTVESGPREVGRDLPEKGARRRRGWGRRGCAGQRRGRARWTQPRRHEQRGETAMRGVHVARGDVGGFAHGLLTEHTLRQWSEGWPRPPRTRARPTASQTRASRTTWSRA